MKNRKSSIFRDALNSKGLVKVAGAHDGLSAKLAEKNGFNAVWASGLGISAVQTVPDASILTMTAHTALNPFFSANLALKPS